MIKFTLTDQYGEKSIFETKEKLEMAHYLFDSDYYLNLKNVGLGSSFKLYINEEEILRDIEIIPFIEKELPEKTNEFKRSLNSDKGFLKKRLIKMGLVEDTSIKYIKRKF